MFFQAIFVFNSQQTIDVYYSAKKMFPQLSPSVIENQCLPFFKFSIPASRSYGQGKGKLLAGNLPGLYQSRLVSFWAFGHRWYWFCIGVRHQTVLTSLVQNDVTGTTDATVPLPSLVHNDVTGTQ